ncbi:hypothetical protein LTR95_009576 [Oleoguttula sp. CCFEE 5521]
MALQTPRQRSALQRPSFGATTSGSSPSLRASITDGARRPSARNITGQITPASNGKMDLEVGDQVNVPGEMYGTVKFIGSVRGKNGVFVGVELDADFAARGKNDGDVDGNFYFNTTIRGAGIFLPIGRAEKRVSSNGSYGDPSTPSYSTLNGARTTKETKTPPTPALTHKFSQTVGPGAQRPTSPMFKPKRPSLPRPESPLRRQPPTLAPTPARQFSQSVRGGRPPLGSTPSKSSFKSSVSGRAPAVPTPRPYSRTGSRMGNRDDERPSNGYGQTVNGRTTSTSSVPSFSQPLRSPSRLGSGGGGQDIEIQRLKSQLAERDRRNEELQQELAAMDSTVKEISALMPADGQQTPRGLDDDGRSGAQLRQALREKNEKISMLTAEFDAHRADFRSTLDSLEMASAETERVYEEQKRDLLAQLQDLQEVSQHREDIEGVANQLKQLEELVAELEEGLEESRRGEAEARGEVEFLRGEVERGRSELRREREKAAAKEKHGSAGSGAEIEQRDDEIRGLKAIVNSLSTGHEPVREVNGHGAEDAELRETAKRLQTSLDTTTAEKEELEREVEQLRRDGAAASAPTTNGHSHQRNDSQMTQKVLPNRSRGDTVKATFADRARQAALDNLTRQDDTAVLNHQDDEPRSDGEEEADGVFCELCKKSDHDTLDCTQLQTAAGGHDSHQDDGEPETEAAVKPLSPVKAKADAGVGASVTEEVNGKEEDKWCALCEKDGHLAYDCPEEQY